MTNENEYGKIDRKIIGVYKIECNGKIYVGSSSESISVRWKKHIRQLNHGNHGNKYLQNSYNKYGNESFLFSVLEIVEHKEDIIATEQKYINDLKPEFNICQIAGSCLGRKLTEENKQKLRDRIISEETRQKLRDRIFPEEGKQKLRDRVISEETRQKLRDRVISEETRQKMSKSKKGRKVSEETKQKLRDRITSEETRQKISTSLLGKSRSKESIQKMIETKLRKKLLKENLTNEENTEITNQKSVE